MRRQALALGLGAAAILTIVQARAADQIYELRPSAATVHRGFFDATLKPVLTIDSGDIVRLWTATGNPRYFESLGIAKEKIPPELFTAYEGVQDDGRDDHNLDGPIAVRGAEPGDTVEIRIRAIDLWLPIAAMSFRANKGSLPEDFPYSRDRVFFLDLAKRAVEFAPGVNVPVKPFWGVIGVAPPRSMGRVPSGPPNVFGGNMDNHDLQPGTSLFLPVHERGALISIGDGHAVQGDGEVGMSAVETSLKGEIQVVLHKGMHITWPRAETPTHYMTMGLHEDLNQAAKIATREMLNFIVETKGIPRDDALMLLSAAMDLHVTEIVDGTKGVHAMIPKSVFRN
ncbi:MAG TPA: acetamidase/formamidase family protein [Xanthobacteraceae bacterium]|jgi:acetamidase/formamidase|nr:acetamidase/formamidase family protein [Xanthobacteraceae bacterium]